MAKGKKMSAAVKAKLAAYHRAHKRAKHNPRGFGGAALGRDKHGRFVKLNPRAADWGYKVGKYSKKAKKGAKAAYGHARDFFSSMRKGYHENPFEAYSEPGRYGTGPFPMPMMNPKKRRTMTAAQRAAHYKSMMAQMEVNGLATGIERARYAKMAQYVAAHGGARKNPYGVRGYGVGPFPMPTNNPHRKGHKSASKARRGASLARSLRRDAHGRFLPRGY